MIPVDEMEPVGTTRSKVNAQFRHNAGSSVLPKVSLANLSHFFVSAKLLLGQMVTRKSDPPFPWSCVPACAQHPRLLCV